MRMQVRHALRRCVFALHACRNAKAPRRKATKARNGFTHDHLGTGRFAYNQAKAQTGMVEHDPYGRRITQSGYVPYHEFTGKPYEQAFNAYYFPFRYYNPSASRWLAPDPAGLIDGPNVYGYVRGNPTNTIDYLGLWCIPIGTEKRLLRKESLFNEKLRWYVRGIEGNVWATVHKLIQWRYYWLRQTEWYCCKRECGSRKCWIETSYKRWQEERWKIHEIRSARCITFGTFEIKCQNPWTGRWVTVRRAGVL